MQNLEVLHRDIAGSGADWGEYPQKRKTIVEEKLSYFSADKMTNSWKI